MTLTFFGKKLKKLRTRYRGKPEYHGGGAYVYYGVENNWCALSNFPHGMAGNARGATPQEALDKCEAVTIEKFRELGATLGYDVE